MEKNISYTKKHQPKQSTHFSPPTPLSPGKSKGLEARFPFSFPKAINEPVRVMPPMKSPSTAAMFSMEAPASGVCTKEPMEVPYGAMAVKNLEPKKLG